MLISREAWQRVGLFDERLDSPPRGSRLLLARPPRRVPRVDDAARAAPVTGTRPRPANVPPERHRRTERYYEERAAIVAMLKNYGLPSLLWVLPLAILIGVVPIGVPDAHPTVRRRARPVGRVGLEHRAPARDDLPTGTDAVACARSRIATCAGSWSPPGVRLPRWFTAAGQIFDEQREIEEQDEDESVSRRLRDRTASLVGSHPVLVASFLGALVAAVAFRQLLGPEPLHGGALAMFPGSWQGFFGELASGYRTTGLGGTLAASPSLGAMGGLSWLSFGSTAIAQKVLLAGGPILASVMLYRALARLTGRPGAAVLGAVSYGLSAMVLWSFSDGRIPLLVALCVLPVLFERLESAFGRGELPDGRWRFIAGVAVTLAVGVAFMPGVALAVGVLVVVQIVFGAARGRGLVIAAAAVAAAAVLLFPFVPTMISGGAARPGFDDRHDGPRLAGAAGVGRRAGHVVDRCVPADRRRAGVLTGRPRAPRRREPRRALGVPPGWRSRGARPPATSPRGRRTRRSTSRWPRSGRRWSSAWGSRRSSPVSAASRSGSGRSARRCWRPSSAPGSCSRRAAAMVGGWAVGGPDALPARMGRRVEQRQGGVPRDLAGRRHRDLVRRARGRPGGRRAERRVIDPVRADRARRAPSRRTRAGR